MNVDPELAVIGGIILANSMLDDAAEIITADDFGNIACGRVFRECVACRDAGMPFDAVLLCKNLSDADAPGGNWVAFLGCCMETVQHAANTRHYARLVLEQSLRIQFGHATNAAQRQIQEGGEIREVIANLETDLHRLMERETGDSHDLTGILDEIETRRGQDSPACPTGFNELDDLLAGGMRGGQLIVVAARPSMGKSAFAGCLGLNVAQQGGSVLIVSLEQSRRECGERFLAVTSQTPLDIIQAGEFSDLDAQRITEAQNKLSRHCGQSLRISDHAKQNVSQIAAAARLRKRRFGLDLVIIDYLQLITPDDSKLVREQQVSTISRSLKCLARDLDVPVICLAQLNRSVESRENKTPWLSDLRESGAIEQDADSVWFIHQSDAPDTRSLTVAKNRNGRTGRIELLWRDDTVTFQAKATQPESGWD